LGNLGWWQHDSKFSAPISYHMLAPCRTHFDCITTLCSSNTSRTSSVWRQHTYHMMFLARKTYCGFPTETNHYDSKSVYGLIAVQNFVAEPSWNFAKTRPGLQRERTSLGNKLGLMGLRILLSTLINDLHAYSTWLPSGTIKCEHRSAPIRDGDPQPRHSTPRERLWKGPHQ
jgi:hypothetical protein